MYTRGLHIHATILKYMAHLTILLLSILFYISLTRNPLTSRCLSFLYSSTTALMFSTTPASDTQRRLKFSLIKAGSIRRLTLK